MAGPQLIASGVRPVSAGDQTTGGQNIPPQVQAIINQRIAQAGGVTSPGPQQMTQGAPVLTTRPSIGDYQADNQSANMSQQPFGDGGATIKNPIMMDTMPQKVPLNTGAQQPTVQSLANPGMGKLAPVAVRPPTQMTPQPAPPVNNDYLQRLSRISPQWAQRVRNIMTMQR